MFLGWSSFVSSANAQRRDANLWNAQWWRRPRPNAHLRVMNSTRTRCDTAAGDGGSTRGLHTLAAPRARGRHGLMLHVHAVQASTLAPPQVSVRAHEAAARARTLTQGMCARATARGLHPLNLHTRARRAAASSSGGGLNPLGTSMVRDLVYHFSTASVIVPTVGWCKQV